MTIIQNEYARGSIVFDCDYRTGSIADKSPYKAAATVTAPVDWARTKQGYGIRTQTGGRISYASNNANKLTGSNATFVALGKFERHPLGNRILSKRGVSGTSYELYCFTPDANKLAVYDGSGVERTFASPISGRSCIAVTLLSGVGSACYLDGTFSANASGASTIPSNDSDLCIGGYYNGENSLGSIIQRVVIFNRVLTPAEISQLYTELMSERYPLRAYSFGCRISAPKDPPGVAALLKTDFTTRLADGRLADLSGNGWHGTVKPGFAAGPGMCGNSLVATSATRSYVDFGDVAPINGASKLTVLWYGKRGSSNPGEAIITKDETGTSRILFYYGTVTAIFDVVSFTNRALVNTANVNTVGSLGVVFDGTASNSEKVKFYEDGKALSTTVPSNYPSALPNNVGTSLAFGKIGWAASTYQPAPQNDFFAIYPAALTPEQVGYVYKQIARRSTFALDMQRVPVSLANMVGPCEIPGTPFRLQSGGTWKVSEDAAGKRWFESVAGNYKSVYVPSTQAYGTYVFDVYHNTGAMSVMFGSNTTDISAANRNMYAVGLAGTVITLYKLSPSNAFTILFASSNALVANTLYTIAVTRNSSGQFYVYIKGGAYGQWTLLTATSGANPSTDTAYTTSSFFAACASTAVNAGKFGNVRMFAGPMTIDMLKEACP